MREETLRVESLSVAAESLEHACGAPLSEVLAVMSWVQKYVVRCVSEGCEHDFRVAMERARLGDLAEALLPLAKR